MTSAPLPPPVMLAVVEARLRAIFEQGTEAHNYVTRDIAVRTVFVMLYVGAVEGAGRYVGPRHVYRMSDEQAALASDAERIEYGRRMETKGSTPLGRAWYADNSREPIRDETLRDGLIPLGAVLTRADVPTTSQRPRYALRRDFASLFDPNLDAEELEAAIESWRAARLSGPAKARLRIVRAGASLAPSGILVELPSGETRRLEPGPSSQIAKGVIEEFAPRFLVEPALIWLSQSGKKVVSRDDELARELGITIDPSRTLPDIILADLREDGPILVFVEVVASDGAVNETRRLALAEAARGSGFDEARVAYVTAYLDRADPAARRTVSRLAWNTFAWFAAEPHGLVSLHSGKEGAIRLHALLNVGR